MSTCTANQTVVAVCLCCGNVRREGVWQVGDVAPDELPSHTYCPQCFTSVAVGFGYPKEKLEKMKERGLI